MRLVLIWPLVTYAALKLGSVARPRSPGFARTDVGWLDRLRAREPGLVLLSILLSVPIAMLAQRHVHRTLASQYAHAIVCYGRIKALRALPEFRDHAGDFAVYERAEGHRQTAYLMGRDLEITHADVDIALNDKDKLHANRYAVLQKQGRRAALHGEIDSGRRCLLPPGPD